MKKYLGGNLFVGNENKVASVLTLFSKKVFAEEKDTDSKEEDTDPEEDKEIKDSGTQINYEDLISKARREEKEKQYSRIKELKTQVDSMTTKHNNALIKNADLELKLEEANKKLTTAGSGDSEAVKTLKDTISVLTKEKEELEDTITKLEGEKPVSREELEEEIRTELEAEFTVKTYKAEKMTELRDKILVPELVGGSTVEEIDASIESALERSREIRKNLGLDEDGKKIKRTPKSSSNPDVSKVQNQEYSLDYLASLDPASEEYKKVRKELGLR